MDQAMEAWGAMEDLVNKVGKSNPSPWITNLNYLKDTAPDPHNLLVVRVETIQLLGLTSY